MSEHRQRDTTTRSGLRQLCAVALGRLRMWQRRDELDAALARGDALDGDLAEHAARLRRSSARRTIASELEIALWAGQRPPTERPVSQIDINREAVLAARPALEILITRLRSPSPVNPRGVALSDLLVRDAQSPLYEPVHKLDLMRAALHAVVTLDEPDSATREAPDPCSSSCAVHEHSG